MNLSGNKRFTSKLEEKFWELGKLLHFAIFLLIDFSSSWVEMSPHTEFQFSNINRLNHDTILEVVEQTK